MVSDHFLLGRVRWAVVLPVMALALTASLLIAAGDREREYYAVHRSPGMISVLTEFCPYERAAAFFVNGPAFLPLPLPPLIDVPYADRLYAVFLGWTCFGIFLDWKRAHPARLVVRGRLRRTVLFSIIVLVLTMLALSLVYSLGRDGVTFQLAWQLFLENHFQTGLAHLIVILGWVVALDLWALRNAYGAYTLASGP